MPNRVRSGVLPALPTAPNMRVRYSSGSQEQSTQGSRAKRCGFIQRSRTQMSPELWMARLRCRLRRCHPSTPIPSAGSQAGGSPLS